jgi:hypothetical protein
MTDRQRLPNRGLAEISDIEVVGLRYTCTVGRFADGRLAEVFLTNHRAGSDAGAVASDSTVVASICFQYGVPIEVTRKALMCDGPGRARTPLAGVKCGTDADTSAKDAAIVASIALQSGAQLDTIRRALTRNRDGSAAGPLGCTLDILTAGQPRECGS